MIGVAAIGAGVMGSLHARNFGTFGGRARVTRVFDPDEEKAARLADSLGAERLDDVEAAVSGPDVDAVAICVPPRLNRDLVDLAFAHGKHVFLEKPIATTSSDADAIMAFAERSDTVLMVGLVLRFWPGYTDLHDVVASGRIGEPAAITGYRLQPPPSTTGWLADVGETGGIAPLVLVHDFDVMNWFLGTPRRVSARALRGAGVSAPHVVVTVEYDRARGFVEGSMAMPDSYPFSTSTHVHCEHGSAMFGYEIGAPEAGDGDGRDAGRFTPLEEPVVTVYHDRAGAPEIVRLSDPDPWRPELDYFLDCVENRRRPEHGSPEQARLALEMALATNRALETGDDVPLSAA